jgi:hypothetical protein
MESLMGVSETIRRELDISLAALGGGEDRGEMGFSAVAPSRGACHLTLPAPSLASPRKRGRVRVGVGSPPSPPASGRRGPKRG